MVAPPKYLRNTMDQLKVGRLGPFPRVNKPVFITSALLIVGFIIFGAFFNDMASTVFSAMQSFITHRFGWMFLILMNLAVFLCLLINEKRQGYSYITSRNISRK